MFSLFKTLDSLVYALNWMHARGYGIRGGAFDLIMRNILHKENYAGRLNNFVLRAMSTPLVKKELETFLNSHAPGACMR